MIQARRPNRIRNVYQKTTALFSRSIYRWAGGVLLVCLIAGAGWVMYRGGMGNSLTASGSVQELRARIEELQANNQELRKKNRSLSWKLHQLQSKVSGRSGGSGTKTKSSTNKISWDETLPTEGPGEEGKKHPDNWINVVGLDYPLRSELLREPIFYRAGPEDSLSKLAHQYYHDSGYWKALHRANRDVLSSPDVLPAGTKLRLPPVQNLSR